MILPSNLKIKGGLEKGNVAIFSLGPLPKGFGMTIGNSLRRVLLSSIQGGAISQVKFLGATHQFTTLPGVKEDVLQLTLNLKQIFVKMDSSEPVVLELSAKGSGEVKAGDIKVPTGVQIVNKDLIIANLADKKSILEVELIVEKGVGYSLAEERPTGRFGAISLDCAFSPVLSVSYRVEKTRFGAQTDLDLLVIEIKTNGALTPKEALMQAAKILADFFFRLSTGEESASDEVPQVKVAPREKSSEASELPIDDIPLPTRVVNSLKKNGILTVADILSRGKGGLSQIKNIGDKSLSEVEAILKKEGFELK